MVRQISAIFLMPGNRLLNFAFKNLNGRASGRPFRLLSNLGSRPRQGRRGATRFFSFVGDQLNIAAASHAYCSRAYPNTVRKDLSAREYICTVSSGELSL